MKLLKKIAIVLLALFVFVVIDKVIHIIILIIGAIIFGDGAATDINAVGEIVGFLIGAVLAQRLYRRFFPLTKKEKSFKLTK